MSSPDFLITVGVSTTGGATENSARIIEQQLEGIVNTINKKPFKILMEVDDTSIANIKTKIQTELNGFIKKNPIQITIDDAQFSSNFADQIKNYINNQFRRLAGLPEIKFKTSVDSSGIAAGVAAEKQYTGAVKETEKALQSQANTAKEVASTQAAAAKKKEKAEVGVKKAAQEATKAQAKLQEGIAATQREVSKQSTATSKGAKDISKAAKTASKGKPVEAKQKPIESTKPVSTVAQPVATGIQEQTKAIDQQTSAIKKNTQAKIENVDIDAKAAYKKYKDLGGTSYKPNKGDFEQLDVILAQSDKVRAAFSKAIAASFDADTIKRVFDTMIDYGGLSSKAGDTIKKLSTIVSDQLGKVADSAKGAVQEKLNVITQENIDLINQATSAINKLADAIDNAASKPKITLPTTTAGDRAASIYKKAGLDISKDQARAEALSGALKKNPGHADYLEKALSYAITDDTKTALIQSVIRSNNKSLSTKDMASDLARITGEQTSTAPITVYKQERVLILLDALKEFVQESKEGTLSIDSFFDHLNKNCTEAQKKLLDVRDRFSDIEDFTHEINKILGFNMSDQDLSDFQTAGDKLDLLDLINEKMLKNDKEGWGKKPSAVWKMLSLGSATVSDDRKYVQAQLKDLIKLRDESADSEMAEFYDDFANTGKMGIPLERFLQFDAEGAKQAIINLGAMKDSAQNVGEVSSNAAKGVAELSEQNKKVAESANEAAEAMSKQSSAVHIESASKATKAQEEIRESTEKTTKEIERQGEVSVVAARKLFNNAYKKYKKLGGKDEYSKSQITEYAHSISDSREIQEAFEQRSKAIFTPEAFEDMLYGLNSYKKGRINSDNLLASFSESITNQFIASVPAIDRFVRKMQDALLVMTEYRKASRTAGFNAGDLFDYVSRRGDDSAKKALNVNQGFDEFAKNIAKFQIFMPKIFGRYTGTIRKDSRIIPNNDIDGIPVISEDWQGRKIFDENATLKIKEILYDAQDAVDDALRKNGIGGTSRASFFDYSKLYNENGLKEALRYIQLIELEIGKIDADKLNLLKEALGLGQYTQFTNPIFKENRSGVVSPTDDIEAKTYVIKEQTDAINANTEATEKNVAASKQSSGASNIDYVSKAIERYREVGRKNYYIPEDQADAYNKMLNESARLGEAFSKSISAAFKPEAIENIFGILQSRLTTSISDQDVVSHMSSIIGSQLSLDTTHMPEVDKKIVDIANAFNQYYKAVGADQFRWNADSKEVLSIANAFKWMSENCSDTEKQILGINKGMEAFINTVRGAQGVFNAAFGNIGTNINEDTILKPNFKKLEQTLGYRNPYKSITLGFQKILDDYSGSFSAEDLLNKKFKAGNPSVNRIKNVYSSSMGGMTQEKLDLINNTVDALNRLADAINVVNEAQSKSPTASNAATSLTNGSTQVQSGQTSATPVTPEKAAADEAAQALEAYEVVKSKFEERLSRLNGNVPTPAPDALEQLRDILNSVPELAATVVKSLENLYDPNMAGKLLEPIDEYRKGLITVEDAMSSVIKNIKSQFELSSFNFKLPDNDVYELAKMVTKDYGPGNRAGVQNMRIRVPYKEIYDDLLAGNDAARKSIFKVNEGYEVFSRTLDDIIMRSSYFDIEKITAEDGSPMVFGDRNRTGRARQNVDDMYDSIRTLDTIKELFGTDAVSLEMLDKLPAKKKGIKKVGVQAIRDAILGDLNLFDIEEYKNAGGAESIISKINMSTSSIKDFFESTYKVAQDYVKKILLLDQQLQERGTKPVDVGNGKSVNTKLKTHTGQVITRSGNVDENYEKVVADMEIIKKKKDTRADADRLLTPFKLFEHDKYADKLSTVMAMRPDAKASIEKAFEYSLSDLISEKIVDELYNAIDQKVPTDGIKNKLAEIITSQSLPRGIKLSDSGAKRVLAYENLQNYFKQVPAESRNVAGLFEFVGKNTNDAQKQILGLEKGLPSFFSYIDSLVNMFDGYKGKTPFDIFKYLGTDAGAENLNSRIAELTKNDVTLRAQLALLRSGNAIITPDKNNDADYVQGMISAPISDYAKLIQNLISSGDHEAGGNLFSRLAGQFGTLLFNDETLERLSQFNAEVAKQSIINATVTEDESAAHDKNASSIEKENAAKQDSTASQQASDSTVETTKEEISVHEQNTNAIKEETAAKQESAAVSATPASTTDTVKEEASAHVQNTEAVKEETAAKEQANAEASISNSTNTVNEETVAHEHNTNAVKEEAAAKEQSKSQETTTTASIENTKQEAEAHKENADSIAKEAEAKKESASITSAKSAGATEAQKIMSDLSAKYRSFGMDDFYYKYKPKLEAKMDENDILKQGVSLAATKIKDKDQFAQVDKVLRSVSSGSISVDNAIEKLKEILKSIVSIKIPATPKTDENNRYVTNPNSTVVKDAARIAEIFGKFYASTASNRDNRTVQGAYDYISKNGDDFTKSYLRVNDGISGFINELKKLQGLLPNVFGKFNAGMKPDSALSVNASKYKEAMVGLRSKDPDQYYARYFAGMQTRLKARLGAGTGSNREFTSDIESLLRVFNSDDWELANNYVERFYRSLNGLTGVDLKQILDFINGVSSMPTAKVQTDDASKTTKEVAAASNEAAQSAKKESEAHKENTEAIAEETKARAENKAAGSSSADTVKNAQEESSATKEVTAAVKEEAKAHEDLAKAKAESSSTTTKRVTAADALQAYKDKRNAIITEGKIDASKLPEPIQGFAKTISPNSQLTQSVYDAANNVNASGLIRINEILKQIKKNTISVTEAIKQLDLLAGKYSAKEAAAMARGEKATKETSSKQSEKAAPSVTTPPPVPVQQPVKQEPVQTPVVKQEPQVSTAQDQDQFATIDMIRQKYMDVKSEIESNPITIKLISDGSLEKTQESLKKIADSITEGSMSLPIDVTIGKINVAKEGDLDTSAAQQAVSRLVSQAASNVEFKITDLNITTDNKAVDKLRGKLYGIVKQTANMTDFKFNLKSVEIEADDTTKGAIGDALQRVFSNVSQGREFNVIIKHLALSAGFSEVIRESIQSVLDSITLKAPSTFADTLSNGIQTQLTDLSKTSDFAIRVNKIELSKNALDQLKTQLGVQGVVPRSPEGAEKKDVNVVTGKSDVDLWTSPLRSQLTGMMRTITNIRPLVTDSHSAQMLDEVMRQVVEQFTNLADKVSVIDGVDKEFMEWCQTTNEENVALQNMLTLISLMHDKIKNNPNISDYMKSYGAARNDVYKLLFGDEAFTIGRDSNAALNGNIDLLNEYRDRLVDITKSMSTENLNEFDKVGQIQQFILSRIDELRKLKESIQELLSSNNGFYPTDKTDGATGVRNAFGVANARASALQSTKKSMEARLAAGGLTSSETKQYQDIIGQINTLLELYNRLTAVKYKTADAAKEAADGFITESQGVSSLIKILPKMTTEERNAAKEATKVKSILSTLSTPLSTLDKAISALENGSGTKGAEARVSKLRDDFNDIKARMQDSMSTTLNTTDAKNTVSVLRKRIAVSMSRANELMASPFRDEQIESIRKSISSNLQSALTLGLNKGESERYDKIVKKMQEWLLTSQQLSSFTKEETKAFMEEGLAIQKETEELNNNSTARKNNIKINLEKQPGVAQFRNIRTMAEQIINDPDKNGAEKDIAGKIRTEFAKLELEYIKFNNTTGSTVTQQRELTKAFLDSMKTIQDLIKAYPTLTAAQREAVKAGEVFNTTNTSRTGAKNALAGLANLPRGKKDEKVGLTEEQSAAVDKLNKDYLNAVASLEASRRSGASVDAAVLASNEAKSEFDRINAEATAILDKVDAEKMYKEAVDSSTEAAIKNSAVIRQLGDSTENIRKGLVELYSGSLSTEEGANGVKSEAERAADLVSQYQQLLSLRREIFDKIKLTPENGGYENDEEKNKAVAAYTALSEEIQRETELLKQNSAEARKNAEIQGRLSGAKNINASLSSQLAQITKIDTTKLGKDAQDNITDAINKIMAARAAYNDMMAKKISTPKEATDAADAFLKIADEAQKAVNKVQGQAERMQTVSKALFAPLETDAKKLAVEFNKVSTMGIPKEEEETFKKKQQDVLDAIAQASILKKGSTTGESAMVNVADQATSIRALITELTEYLDKLREVTAEEQKKTQEQKIAAEEDARRATKMKELQNSISMLEKNLNKIEGQIAKGIVKEEDIKDLQAWKKALEDANVELLKIKSNKPGLEEVSNTVKENVEKLRVPIGASSEILKGNIPVPEGRAGTQGLINSEQRFRADKLEADLEARRAKYNKYKGLISPQDEETTKMLHQFEDAIEAADKKLIEFKGKTFNTVDEVRAVAQEIQKLIETASNAGTTVGQVVDPIGVKFEDTKNKLSRSISEIGKMLEKIKNTGLTNEQTAKSNELNERYLRLTQTRDTYESNGTKGYASADAFNAASDGIINMANALKEQTSDLYKNTVAINDRNKTLKHARDLEDKVNKSLTNFTAARNGKSSESYKELRNYSNELQQLISGLENGTITVDVAKTKFTELSANVAKSTNAIKAAHENTKTFGERMAGLARQFSYWFSTTRIIMSVVRSIRQLITSSIQLDDKMTQLKVVTQSTTGAYEKYLNSITKVAQETGTAISDLVDSTTTFARLGYSLDESGTLAKFVGMLSSVGNIEVSEASDSITSMIKAFNIDVGDIESVMDKLVVTGNNFPISVPISINRWSARSW